jgi:hypothetical protein
MTTWTRELCAKWAASTDGTGAPITLPKECGAYGFDTRPNQGTKSAQQSLYDQLYQSAGMAPDVLYGFSTKIAKDILAGADISKYIQPEVFAGAQISEHDLGNQEKVKAAIKFALDNFLGPAGQIMSQVFSYASATHLKAVIETIKNQVIILGRYQMLDVRQQTLGYLIRWRSYKKYINDPRNANGEIIDCSFFDLQDWAANIGTEWGAVKEYHEPGRPTSCIPYATLVPELYPHPDWLPILKGYIDARTDHAKEILSAPMQKQQATITQKTQPQAQPQKVYAGGSPTFQETTQASDKSAPSNTKAVVGLAALAALKTVVLGGL